MFLKALGVHVSATLHGRLPGHDASGKPRPDFLAQVDRLAASPVFHGSESLSRLLRYLAERSLVAPADHLKEYQIATEVLGRPLDFDPQTDASVRVQVGRLRNKLTEYYQSVGTKDKVVVRLPKGGYALCFEEKEESPADRPAPSVEPAKPAPPWSRPRVLLVLTLVAASASLITAAILLYFTSGRARVAANAKSAIFSPAMADFWGPFLRDQDGPYVVYSNAGFVGNPQIGMRYFDPARDAGSEVNHHYTGVGELEGAVRLGMLFQQFGHPFRLKRGGLFTLDDALQHDLVFLGSPTENQPLDKVLTTHEFAFGNVSSDPQHRFGVLTLHPHTGETAGFPSTANPNGRDYSIIALAPGLNTSHKILILEGTSTLTTQAAVDFVCDPTAVSDLVRRLNPNRGSLPTFEAVIQITVTDDVPLETHLVALKKTGN